MEKKIKKSRDLEQNNKKGRTPASSSPWDPSAQVPSSPREIARQYDAPEVPLSPSIEETSPQSKLKENNRHEEESKHFEDAQRRQRPKPIARIKALARDGTPGATTSIVRTTTTASPSSSAPKQQIKTTAAPPPAATMQGKKKNSRPIVRVRNINHDAAVSSAARVGTKTSSSNSTKSSSTPPSIAPGAFRVHQPPPGSSIISARQNRYNECMAIKSGRQLRGGGGGGGGGSNDNSSSGPTRNVTTTGGAKSSPSPSTKQLAKLTTAGSPSVRHTRYNEAMAAKRGAAGGHSPAQGDYKETAERSAAKVSGVGPPPSPAGRNPELSSDDDDSVGASSTGSLSSSVVAAPTNLARGTRLRTAVRPGAEAVGDGDVSVIALPPPLPDAPQVSEASVTSHAAVGQPGSSYAPSPNSVGVEEAQVSVVNAHLVVDDYDDENRIERRVDDRVNERLAEHANNLIEAEVVVEGDRREPQRPQRAAVPAAASPWKMLVIYCVAVLVPMALASVVVGVVVGGGRRDSGASAASNGDTIAATRTPTETASLKDDESSSPSVIPREPPTDLSSQPSLSPRSGRPTVSWEFWPTAGQAPSLSSGTVQTVPSTGPPSSSNGAGAGSGAGSGAGIGTGAGALPLHQIPCSSGYYYSVFYSPQGNQVIQVVDVVHGSRARELSTPDCSLRSLAFDTNGTAYGLCSADQFVVESPAALVTVDLQRGTTTKVAASSDPDYPDYMLTYNPADDHLYSLRFNPSSMDSMSMASYGLTKINKIDGTKISIPSSLPSDLLSIAIDSNGQAYGLSSSTLYSVNLTDGTSAELQGSLPVGHSHLLGFSGMVLYGIALENFPIPVFALILNGSSFTTTPVATIDASSGDLLEGSFCSLAM